MLVNVLFLLFLLKKQILLLRKIIFKENVPAKVAINEYVNVAAAFFEAEEAALANAVLNALARARRPQEFAA